MPEQQRATHQQSGFSLIMVSILLTAAALIFVSMLPGQEGGDINQKNINNTRKLERVEEAMRSFMAFQGRRPCPADGQYALNTANFGLEAATPGTCTGGTPAAPMGPDAGTGNIVGGVIPTKTLGLPDDYALDDYNRRFTYVVDKRATSNSTCLTLEGITSTNSTAAACTSSNSGVTIENATGGTVIDYSMYAYISHGASGYGAFPEQGSTVANRINSGSTDTDMQTNAAVNSSFVYSTTHFTNVKVQKDRVAPTSGDTGFNDLVWYRPDIKNYCCLGPLCVAAAPASFNIWVVENGNNCVEKFNSSGTSLMKFGSHGSGNGQFRSPEGIAIDAGGNIWVVDSDNNRVEEFNSSGNYLSQFGSHGSGNGQFSNAQGIAIDAGGNIWVVDAGPDSVQEFSSSGNYLSQFNPDGGDGPVDPTYIAIH